MLLVLDSSIKRPLHANVTGLKSKRGRLAFTVAMKPDELTAVAVLPDRAIVTRESRLAVVKSNASLGSTRSVAVSEKAGVIIIIYTNVL